MEPLSSQLAKLKRSTKKELTPPPPTKVEKEEVPIAAIDAASLAGSSPTPLTKKKDPFRKAKSPIKVADEGDDDPFGTVFDGNWMPYLEKTNLDIAAQCQCYHSTSMEILSSLGGVWREIVTISFPEMNASLSRMG
ncbi:hypothetical protein PIB30_102152 [Stylosanthes scabra]|uniref:Uncharacterized protein n=1 Tax=Stylosanthes scabra TaxID=79078 RepID=A0ABU6RY44_9FABA|nr:hypothetical protein [Stylosanthes scabra]